MPDVTAAIGNPHDSGPHGAQYIAPDAHGRNFYAIDRQFQDLLSLYMEPGLLKQMTPHFERLGELAGNRLDDLAMTADKHPPALQPRDRFGRDEDWIDYHPSYREMEKIAFEEFGMHAMTHRAGVLGMKEAADPLVKYAITYLFVQAEFGLMCPVSVSDTSNFVIKRFGSEALKKLLLDRLLSQDPATMLKGTQFMTEKAGGSDVGALETEAERIGVGADGVERWKLFGQKWFCSHADADVAVLLARPRGAAPGTRGLGMFAMPRRLEDGSRNSYRIVRLKDKLGTRSMASGEIIMDGAIAYLVGDAGGGFKQMMEQVNLSRLSHGVRAASMMRRCLNEAMVVAQNRRAFGKVIGEYPLLRRQLMKIMLPTEQALSMYAFSADAMGKANAGDQQAASLLRILTPVYKFRACRDNIPVASHALEVRGGLGYIEEWVTARLVRDAQIGTLWEGTSNINALDVVQRAVGKAGGHKALTAALKDKYERSDALPGQYKGLLGATLDRVERFVEAVAADPGAGEALSPGRRRALSRHDGGIAGLGGRHARRQGRRCAPPLAVAAGDRASAGAAGSVVAERIAVGAGGDGPPAAGQAGASRQGHGSGRIGAMTTALPPQSWTVTSVLERSYVLARDNFAAFFTVAVIFGAVSLVMNILSLGLLAGLVGLVCSVATSICLTWGTLQAIGGRKPEWEPMLRQLQGPMFGRLLLLGCIQYFVIAVSMIVVIGPLFLIPLWAVTIPVMMIERTDIGGAFNRSMDLTAGRRLPILGAFLLWLVIFALGALVIILVFGHGALGSLALWIYGALAGIVVHTLPAIFYVLLREEKEGISPAQIAATAQ